MVYRIQHISMGPGARQLPDNLFGGMPFVKADNPINKIIHDVDTAAVNINYNLVAIQFKLMNHLIEMPGWQDEMPSSISGSAFFLLADLVDNST